MNHLEVDVLLAMIELNISSTYRTNLNRIILLITVHQKFSELK